MFKDKEKNLEYSNIQKEASVRLTAYFSENSNRGQKSVDDMFKVLI